jgi:2'-5' RNA ligase
MAPAVGAIDRFRRRLDPSSRYEMPAHVTVLYPFMAPALITGEVLGELTELLGTFASFDFSLSEVRWFDQRVVYLAPSPEESFRQLTATVSAQFPQYPPYEGAFSDVVPHVTVGEDAPRQLLRAAGWLAKRRLPITGRVTEVWLMTIGNPEPVYRVEQVFPLR